VNDLKKTVIGVFSAESRAEQAVRQLRDSGFSGNEISIVSKDDGRRESSRGGGAINRSSYEGGTMSGDRRSGMGMDQVSDGALSGAAWGGLAGLALGAGALAIPGVGPLLAAGPISAALTGAATGGLAGGLLDWGIPEDRGRHYEDRVKRGDLLAIIQVSDRQADRAAAVLRENGAQDVEIHDHR
jgi:outer membrane lipoprotein SlyB